MLSVIMSTAERMLDRFGADGPASGDIRDILAAARRAMEITRQFLAFARRQPITPQHRGYGRKILTRSHRLCKTFVNPALPACYCPKRSITFTALE